MSTLLNKVKQKLRIANLKGERLKNNVNTFCKSPRVSVLIFLPYK